MLHICGLKIKLLVSYSVFKEIKVFFPFCANKMESHLVFIWVRYFSSQKNAYNLSGKSLNLGQAGSKDSIFKLKHMRLCCTCCRFSPPEWGIRPKPVSVPALGKALDQLTCMTLLAGSCRSWIFIVKYTRPELETNFFQFNTGVRNWEQNFESCSREQHPAGPHGLYLKVIVHKNSEFRQYCSFIFFSFRSIRNTPTIGSLLVRFCSFALPGCKTKHEQMHRVVSALEGFPSGIIHNAIRNQKWFLCD